MTPFQESINQYRKQLRQGDIQIAYRGLMEYIMGLRYHFMKKYPDYDVPGSIYYGYMDMTYFSVLPKSLKKRKLKIAIVFLHEAFRFEVWLSAVNKQIQKQYWELLKESNLDKYKLVPPGKGIDSIVEFMLVDNPDFSNLDVLTKRMETGVLKFIQDIESFLSKH
jgi:hypothetical protein